MKEKQYNKIERQLSWYYNNSAADAFKFSSGFGAFITACYKIIVPTDPDNISDSQLRYIKKFRRIHTILRSLPRRHQRAFAALYDWEYLNKYPISCTRFYGARTGLLFFTSHFDSLPKLEKFLKKRLLSQLTDKEKIVSFKVGQELDELYKRIHDDFQTNSMFYDKKK